MKIIALAAGAAAVLLTAGVADAGSKSHKASGAAVASPSQPIPYAVLDEYIAASPKERASRDWWSGQNMAASTGTSANTATSSSMGASTTAPSSAGTTSDTSGGPAGQVNTPTDSGAGAGTSSSTTPSDTSSSTTSPP